MRVLIKARAKFYAVEEDGKWTFQKDGANYYHYPLNSFEYGSKIVEYFKLEEQARMYKADGMRVTDAEVTVSLHKDDADEGEHIFEKYTGTDSEAIIWVDYFDAPDEAVEEGDYIEVDIIGFEDAVTLAIMNMSNTPEPTPPTPTPTVNFEIVNGTRSSDPTAIFDTEPECPAGMVLYPCGNEEEELTGVWVYWDDGGWKPDYKLDTIYDAQTVSRIAEAMEEGDGETPYRFAWVAIDPPADSGNSGSDEEDEEDEEE